MAKFTPGPMVAAVSGSIGGTVFSRNRYGQYTRFRAVPVNPGTIYTQSAKQRLGDISGAWRNLSQEARQSWVTWAQTNTVTDPLGQQITLQGNAAFQLINNRLAASGLDLRTLPPTGGPPPEVPEFSVEAQNLTPSGLPGQVHMFADYDEIPENTLLWVWGAVQTSAGRSNIENSLRLLRTFQVPANEMMINRPYRTRFGSLLVGQNLFMEMAHIGTNTGLMSKRRRAQTIVTAL